MADPRPDNKTLELQLMEVRSAAEAAANQAKTTAAEAEKTADHLRKSKQDKRPHILTLAISLTSIVISLVAVVTSWKSNETSKQSNEISKKSMYVSQRADVSLADRKVELKVVKEKGKDILRRTAEVSFVLRNLGNTRATFTGGFSSVMAPRGWRIVSGGGERRELGVGDLPRPAGAKEEWPWRSSFTYDVRDNISGRSADGKTPTVLMSGVIQYKDVFDESHDARWCLVYFVESKQIADCANQIEKLVK